MIEDMLEAKFTLPEGDAETLGKLAQALARTDADNSDYFVIEVTPDLCMPMAVALLAGLEALRD